MFSVKYIVLIVALVYQVKSSAVPVPVAAPQIGYANFIPQNIQPFARQVSVVNRALNPLVTAPFAAPVAAPYAPVAAPLAAPYAAPVPAPYAAPVPAPLPAPFSAPVVPAPFAPIPEQYIAGPPAVPYATPYSAFPYGPIGYPFAFRR